MTIMQKQTTTFIKKFEGDHEITLTCTTLPLGQLHDFLMEMKGWCVERMVKVQNEEIEHADILKKNDSNEGNYTKYKNYREYEENEEIEHADILKKNDSNECLEGNCDGG